MEFYITKPINRIEVLSVLRQLIFIHTIQQSLEYARQHLNTFAADVKEQDNFQPNSLREVRKRLMSVLIELGIAGEAGVNDITQIILYLHNKSKGEPPLLKDSFNLRKLYGKVIAYTKNDKKYSAEEVRALEQRLRRAVKRCFDNIASLGLEDYSDPRFERYAGTLFDFYEVRKRMSELKKGTRGTNTRINIKKFLMALFFEVSKSGL